MNEFLKDSAREAVDNWLDSTSFEVYSLQADGKEVDLIIAGTGEPPPLEALLQELGGREKGVEVTVRVIQEQKLNGFTD